MLRFRTSSLSFHTVRRLALAAGCIAALVLSTACIDFERAITIGRDGTGRARFGFTMNFEPMIRMALMAERKAQGSDVPPTAGEMAEAMEELSSELSKEKAIDKTAIAKGLPKGITLVDVTQKLNGMKMVVDVVLTFDDVKKLPAVELSDAASFAPGGAAGAPDGPGSRPVMRPFENLKIEDDGKVLTLTSRPLVATGFDKGPAAQQAAEANSQSRNALNELGQQLAEMIQDMGGPAELKSMMEGVVKSMKETFRIETAQAIVEANPTRREAGVLLWEYSIEALAKMAVEERNKLQILAKIRR